MKIQYVLVMVTFGALLGGVVWLMNQEGEPVSLSTAQQERLAAAEVYRYQNSAGEMLGVKFVGELAQIEGGPHNQTVLWQVVSASGAKYEGGRGLTLWSKDGTVRLETAQAVLFEGVEMLPEVTIEVPPTIPNDVPVIDMATTSAMATDSVVGTVWVWEKAVFNAETLTPEKTDVFSVTFGPDGQLRGKTDCNGFGGSYTKVEDTITLSELMMTLMYCDASEESTFTGLLSSPLTIVSSTDLTLVLKNATGAMIEFVKGVE